MLSLFLNVLVQSPVNSSLVSPPAASASASAAYSMSKWAKCRALRGEKTICPPSFEPDAKPGWLITTSCVLSVRHTSTTPATLSIVCLLPSVGGEKSSFTTPSHHQRRHHIQGIQDTNPSISGRMLPITAASFLAYSNRAIATFACAMNPPLARPEDSERESSTHAPRLPADRENATRERCRLFWRLRHSVMQHRPVRS